MYEAYSHEELHASERLRNNQISTVYDGMLEINNNGTTVAARQ